MDSVDPIPNSRPADPKIGQRPAAPKDSGAVPMESGPDTKTNAISAYSDIFDDQELERLQNNLKSVSDLANEALERFKNDR